MFDFDHQFRRISMLDGKRKSVKNIPVTWSQTPRTAFLPCTVAGFWRVHFRRPPPLIDDDRARARLFTWRKGDDEINPKRVSQNGTLEVRRNSGGSEGVYQCSVRHHGHVLGYPINLKFSYMDVRFSKEPEDVTARLGQPLSIPCKISSGPSAILSWTRNNVELPKNDRYYFLDNELLIIDVRREDAGAYRCTASNVNANRNRTSHEGLVTVKESTAEEPSLLTIQHIQNIAVPRESRVVLHCPVLGWPRPKLIWELTPLGGRASELEFAQEVVVLPNLEYDQEGLYACSVEGHSDLYKVFNVTITEPVKITLPPFSKEAMRASTVRFNCTATGRPAPNITWYKDGNHLELAGRINLRTSADRKRIELVISGVTSDDAGVYQCLAWNGVTMASEWARLNVTGAGAAAPGAVQCAPTGVSSVELRWEPAANDVMAYTVDTTPTDKRGVITGQPHKNTVEIVKVKQPLTPYIFQVRAYISSSPTKNIASDMSESVICQGQGVPIKLTKLEDDRVLISWQTFAEQMPGVVQWMLQYKSDMQNGSYGDEHNITLEAKVTNYTLTAPKSSPLVVRLLGSRSLEWLQQNLTLVPWVSTNAAGQDSEDGVINLVPQDLEVTDVSERSFTLKWQCEDASEYMFIVCWRKVDGNEDCQESYKTSTTIEGLQPDTEYEVRVQIRLPTFTLGGAFSAPYHITTQPEGPHRFKDLTYKFINETTLRVSWSGAPATYTVHHSAQLKLPVEQWAAVNTTGNTVIITDIEPIEQTFVMVTGYNPIEYSPIINIPSPVKELEPKDLKYVYTSSGVSVWWHGPGLRTVRYAQNITQPLDNWNSVNVSEPKIELNNLDARLPLYVMVTPVSGGRRQHVLTIPPRPPGINDDHYYYYIGLGVGCGACALCALAGGALCIWRRMKASRTPDRSRRQVATSEGAEEEGSEMKVVRGVRGARVANGGAVAGGRGAGRAGGAGEPLLNGHVHITENPVSKTPNGRMKKGRRYEPQAYEAFDVSRNDHDTTIETVLEDTTYSLLDTSRRPEYDLSRSSQNLPANNSFNKLPDDNMNSELTRSTFQLDNSKIQPTLQPNG
ncbi:unnamed protein product, partial [Brenthis ino]